MAIELNQLLAGLDDTTIQKVEQTIKSNAKELEAKIFIDGDGEHYVPHARFDEVVTQREQANASFAEQKEQLEKLSKQVEEGSDAQTTIKTLQEKLAAQSKLAKMATIETKLHPLVTDSIAPVGDLLGFMDLEKIVVSDDGSVSGLTEQLASVRETRSYLFKQTDGEGESNPGQRNTGAGTGNPGNPGNVGAGGKSPKEVGQFGKQIAQAVSSKKNTDEAPQFFR